MTQTPRELVRRALQFQTPERIPRQLWCLPWASDKYPEAVRELNQRHPPDIVPAPMVYRPSPRSKGNPFQVGSSTDEWGCVFENRMAGVIGEVRAPLLPDIDQWKTIRPPYETLPEDIDAARDTVNRFHDQTDLHVNACCCPRPWERYQFLRGTADAMMDVLDPDSGALELLRVIHEFHLRELEFWASTGVDGLMFMDDWGSQQSLLIPPPVWRELFKPLYKDYCDLAHANGKFAFMHSDGNIASIYDDLIEVGVDALNSQLFVMDLADLAKRAKGRIAFWGEIDRQHILTSPDPAVARAGVREVARHLYDPRGGIIAQFEFGPGVEPEGAFAVFDEWERIHEQGLARPASSPDPK